MLPKNTYTLAILAGIFGTLMMDIGNIILSQYSFIHPIKYSSIGALINSWINFDFIHSSVLGLKQYEIGVFPGGVVHYAIGIFFCLFICAGERSYTTIFIYAFLTTLISLFLVYPSLGIKVFTNEVLTLKVVLTSVVNHLFYAIGVVISYIYFNKQKLKRHDQ